MLELLKLAECTVANRVMVRKRYPYPEEHTIDDRSDGGHLISYQNVKRKLIPTMSFQDIIDHAATPFIGLGLIVLLCALAVFLWFLQLRYRIRNR